MRHVPSRQASPLFLQAPRHGTVFHHNNKKQDYTVFCALVLYSPTLLPSTKGPFATPYSIDLSSFLSYFQAYLIFFWVCFGSLRMRIQASTSSNLRRNIWACRARVLACCTISPKDPIRMPKNTTPASIITVATHCTQVYTRCVSCISMLSFLVCSQLTSAHYLCVSLGLSFVLRESIQVQAH